MLIESPSRDIDVDQNGQSARTYCINKQTADANHTDNVEDSRTDDGADADVTFGHEDAWRQGHLRDQQPISGGRKQAYR